MNDYDPLDLQTQERKRADAAQQNRVSKDTEESDIKYLMSNRRGRRILWTLLDRCGTFGDTFSTNSMVMANRAGQQGVGRVYFALIQAVAPDQYATMVKEAKERNGQRNDDDGSRNAN